MNQCELCPTCGRNRQKLTEEEIVSVINYQNWGVEDNRAKNIAQALIKTGFAFKDAIETFSFKDGDVVNEIVPELRLLPGEVRLIELAFKDKYKYC